MGHENGVKLADSTENESLHLTFRELAAGATAGFAEHFVMFPFDTIKTRIQSGKASNTRDACRHLCRDGSIKHLYRGCAPVIVSAIPAHGAYFGVYEAFKRMMGEESNAAIVVSASCATVAHDTVSTPFDVIKQRMQMDKKRQYLNSYRCGKHVLQAEGMQALFKSLPTTIIMNIPHFAAYWVVYESFLSYHTGTNRRDQENEMALDYMCAGFLAGASASVVSFPFDVVKTHLQLGMGTGFFPTLGNMIRTRGIGGLFAGLLPRIMYTAPSGAIMMVTYETVKSALAFEEGAV